MHPRCAQSVRAAAGGREVSDAKLAQIDAAMGAQMREMARRDPAQWRGMSREQRYAEAAKAAMGELQREADLKVFRASLAVLRADEADARITDMMSREKLTRSQALIRDVEHTIEQSQGLQRQAMADLKTLIDTAGDKAGVGIGRRILMTLFDVDNPGMTADVVREVFKNADGATGNKAAQLAAKAWLETIEGLRTRFNAAGGDVGKLSYGYLSQLHDAIKVRKAGAEAWAREVLPLLDRKQYLHENGQMMDDGAVLAMLKEAHATIESGGLNKQTPGQFKGNSAKANAGSESRVIHFKDGDAWMEYMSRYGEGSMYDVMMGHIGAMTRNIALVEAYGPNPNNWFRVQQDIAKAADHTNGGKDLLNERAFGNRAQAYWDIATGVTGAPENALLAWVGASARNIQTAAKIVMGPFSAMADIATIANTLHFNRIPISEYLREYAKRAGDKQVREDMQAHGIMGQALLNTMNRWTGDNLTHSATGHIANATMKLSLMNMWTDAGRNAFQAVLMRNWAKNLGKTWDQLDEWDRAHLQRAGLEPGDWAIITQAKAAEIDGGGYLSFRSIEDVQGDAAAVQQAAKRWTAFVIDESEYAVVNPDTATRAIVTGGGRQAGTAGGEIARTVAQFKSFPIAMISRHWRRAFQTEQGLEGAPTGFGGQSPTSGTVNAIAVLAALNVSAMFLGAIQIQFRDALAGKDPKNMDPTDEHGPKFWARAWAAGGGAGFLADVLMAPADDPSRRFSGAWGMLGPVPGAVGGLVDVAKSDRMGADAAQWISDQLPFVDMWQTKAAYEHWVLHNIQENLNPGYMARIQQRAQKSWGQSYWWKPGEALPDRAPDLADAIGE
jgi:hypothetical protein